MKINISFSSYSLLAVGCSLLTICCLPLILLFSCQKVINLNLNSSNPQFVVTGSISDQPGPYTVNLTQSVNFSQDNVFPPVQGATVSITDNLGNSEVLKNTSPGNYTGSVLQGTPGRTYTLSITANGKTYSGASTMPTAVDLDTLTVDSTDFFGGGSSGGRNGSGHYAINTYLQDPSGAAHYYRFVEVVNGITKNNIFILSDEYQSGKLIERTLSTGDSTVQAGDSVTIYIQSIDYPVYQYFNTLKQTIQNAGGFIQVSDPGNPTSNLNNNALGCFSAYAVRSKSIVVR
jgi:hypothetical protein